MEEFISMLEEIRDDVDFTQTGLIEGKILNSLDIIRIVGLMEEEYGVKVPISKLKPVNFDSVAAMWQLIQELGM